MRQIQRDFRDEIENKLTLKLTEDGIDYFRLVREANRRSTSNEQWLWHHTLITIVARSPCKMTDIRKASQQDRLTVRPNDLPATHATAGYDIDCIAILPDPCTEQPVPIDRSNIALAHIQDQVSRVTTRQEGIASVNPVVGVVVCIFVCIYVSSIHRFRKSFKLDPLGI